MIKKIISFSSFILGCILLYLANQVFTSEEMRLLSGMGYGIGSCLIVYGLGSLLIRFFIPEEKQNEFKKKNQVEVHDERNIRIIEKTARSVSSIMTYTLLVFFLILAIMNVDKLLLILTASLFIIKAILYVIFSNYYAARM